MTLGRFRSIESDARPNNKQQEGLAVISIARDDPSPLPGMNRDYNVPHALRLEFET